MSISISTAGGSDFFKYDQVVSSSRLLTSGVGAVSKVEYDEYVVYDDSPDGRSSTLKDPTEREEAELKQRAGSSSISHRFGIDEASGAAMLDLAFRHGHFLGRDGTFGLHGGEDSEKGVIGRMRRMICFREESALGRHCDQLSLTGSDLVVLGLHPATLHYATRTTTESRFWSPDGTQLSIIMSFSEKPSTPCDFLSMTFDTTNRTTTMLIRQAREPRLKHQDIIDEYDHRLDACRAHWAHPLTMPVVLVQVQFMRSEEAISLNNLNVSILESDVGSIAGFGGVKADSRRSPQRMMTLNVEGVREEKHQVFGPLNMTNLMKKAHEVLKESIQLLDTIRWMERAVKLLIQAGDELVEPPEDSVHSLPSLNISGREPGACSRRHSPRLTAVNPNPNPNPFLRGENERNSHLDKHWHEIRQYLDGLLRLCLALETDRRMTEARCRAQIDIIYSRMAQEDNVLNARMAVSSSRDSSSMKALAVITALFLPGEFIGTLFGMSMFDWLEPEDVSGDDKGSGSDSKGSGNGKAVHAFTRLFWIYWSLAIPLTLFTLCMWRAWWVVQDRYFRRHLSQDLSEERFWTSDGKPRPLARSFIHDFFHLSARRDEQPCKPVEPKEKSEGYSTGQEDDHHHHKHAAASEHQAKMRQRQIFSLRRHPLRQSVTA